MVVTNNSLHVSMNGNCNPRAEGPDPTRQHSCLLIDQHNTFSATRKTLMKWITRSHVHVDRVACPWLVSRFIDSAASFLFVPKSKVLEIATETGAIPFDTPGAALHHRDGLCTFDVIIQEYGLTDKALLRMAKVINAADTDRLDSDPLAAGFEAIAVGYSLRYPADLDNIERQFAVYDALYAWCRLEVAKNGA